MSTQDLIHYYFEKFTAAVGVAPLFNGPRDGAILKQLSEARGDEEVKAVIDALFTSDDPFLVSTGYSIPAMRGCYNRLLVQVKKRKPKAAEDWYEECQRLHNGVCGGLIAHRYALLEDQREARAKEARGVVTEFPKTVAQ